MEFAGAFYHVTSRGDGRGAVFLSDQDREHFLGTLEHVVGLYRWRVHAWCLMTNHYHLLVDTAEPNLGSGMQQLNGQYAQRFNRTHRRVGHVFQGRYTAIFVERDSYLLELARYVVLNPVRARMVHTAQQWPWSSYRETAGFRAAPAWLTTGLILGHFSKRLRAAALAYRSFVAAGKDQPSPWAALRNQVFLGSAEFVDDLLARMDDQQCDLEIPQAQSRPRAQSLEHYVRANPVRNDAIVVAYQSGGYTLQQIAAHFGLHYSRISRIVSQRHRARAKGKV
jgi:REP element-mobilizing transposase RayT